MNSGKVLAIGVAVLLLEACAVGDDGSDIGPAMSEPEVRILKPKDITPRCERLDDLGVAASAERTREIGRPSAEAHCVSIAGDLITAIGDRPCRLTKPQGFTFDGCADWYDCDGCAVELRQQLNEEFVLTGLSDAPACADLQAAYVLYPGVACE